MKKIAVIWGTHRNDPLFHTHHSFWERTIAEKFQSERFTWNELESIPAGFDLYFCVDFHPALFKVPDRLRPRALYWWDAFHFTFTYPAQVSEIFDRAYFAEKMTAESLLFHGFQNARWLPSGFYPGLYRPLPGRNKVHDYGFIGQQDEVVVRHGLTRKEFITRLGRAQGLHGYIGSGVYGELVNQVYNESKVLFDWTIWNNVGTRFFEVVGSGGFLLMNRMKGNGIDELATDGVHYVSYDGSYQDFEGKLRRYLGDEGERQAIAENGHRHFLAHHTWAHRLDVVLKDFGLV